MDLSWVAGIRRVERCYIDTVSESIPEPLQVIYNIWRQAVCHYPELTVGLLLLISVWVITRF